MPNRFVCSALDEMRTNLIKLEDCLDLLDIDMSSELRILKHQSSLIEEIQTHVNRMEAVLEDRADVFTHRNELRELRRSIKLLTRTEDELRESIEDMEHYLDSLETQADD